MEALYLLKLKLLARDQWLMFSTKQEIQDFVNSHSPGYAKQWLHIWQPYFCKGVNKATRLATTNTHLLTSYFQWQTSMSQAHLPRGYYTIMVVPLIAFKAQYIGGLKQWKLLATGNPLPTLLLVLLHTNSSLFFYSYEYLVLETIVGCVVAKQQMLHLFINSS